MSDKFLVAKLDQYAGNVDEIVCVALTGWGAERYGEEQARKVFDVKVKPLSENPDDEYSELPIEFSNFNTEYGLMPYELDSSSTNNLRIGLDSYADEDSIREMLSVWDKAYGNGEGHLSITVDGLHGKSVTVKVLGFDLVEVVEQRTTLR